MPAAPIRLHFSATLVAAADDGGIRCDCRSANPVIAAVRPRRRLQALSLMNGDLMHEESESIAKRMQREAGPKLAALRSTARSNWF